MPDNNVELRGELKLVLEITARVDERVKLVVEKQAEMTSRLNEFINAHNSLSSRVSVLESKGANGIGEVKNKQDLIVERLTRLELSPIKDELNDLEKIVNQLKSRIISMQEVATKIEYRLNTVETNENSSWSRAKFVFDLVVKAAWAVAVGWLLWKFGFSGPRTP